MSIAVVPVSGVVVPIIIVLMISIVIVVPMMVVTGAMVWLVVFPCRNRICRYDDCANYRGQDAGRGQDHLT